MNVIKRLFGYRDSQRNEKLNDRLFENIFGFLGKDVTITDPDKFDYIKDGYMAVPYAYEAISMIVEKIAACPILIKEVKSKQKLKAYKNAKRSGDLNAVLKARIDDVVEVDVPRIRALLERPNEKQNPDEFIKIIATLLLASGNALAYGVSGDKRTKKLSEIWALPFNPLQYKIVSGGVFEPITAYRVNSVLGNYKFDFPASEIAHFKTVNPLWEVSAGQLYGMSPLHAYIAQLERAKLGSKATNRLLNNGFKMGIISPKVNDPDWTADQAKGVKEMIRRAASSMQAYDRILSTSHGVEFLPVGLDSTELGIDVLNKADREDVYAAYKIPRLMATTDASTFNNEEIVGRKFIYNAVAPYCELIADVLTQFICEPFKTADGKTYVIELDYLSLPELATDMAKAVEWLSKASFLTWNEKREVLGWGRLDIAGMDEPIGSKNDVPLSRIVSGQNLTTNSAANSKE